MFKTLPPYFFPTTAVFLDDEEHFLKSIFFGLGESNLYKKEKLTDVEKLKDLIKRSPKPRGFMNLGFEDNYNNVGVVLDIQNIHKYIYDDNRYNLISSIIIDYNLGHTTGLEVFSCFREEQLVSKILLTGEADEIIATNAFNEGVINGYVRKQDLHMVKNIDKFIASGQKKYFEKSGEELLRHFDNINYVDTALGDPEYKNFFNQTLVQKNIVEGYLLDPMGSYLLIDAEGKDYSLIAYSKDQIEANKDIFPFADSQQTIREARRSLDSNKITFYPSSELFKEPPIFKIDRVPNSKTIYYSLEKNKFKFGVKL